MAKFPHGSFEIGGVHADQDRDCDETKAARIESPDHRRPRPVSFWPQRLDKALIRIAADRDDPIGTVEVGPALRKRRVAGLRRQFVGPVLAEPLADSMEIRCFYVELCQGDQVEL